MSHPVFDEFDHAWITSFWGWKPEIWGCIGFTQEGRRNTFLKEESDPFLMVIYVTENAKNLEDERLAGQVAGFYEVTKVIGDRNEFIHPSNFDLAPEQWRYSLKASRAFEILPEFRPSIREFEPEIHENKREQTVAKNAALLSEDAFERLESLPIREVPVYGVNTEIDPAISTPASTSSNGKGYVSCGAHNGSGYNVPPESDSEKELYILRLLGNTNHFLGYPSEECEIFKVGLSISPETRRACFNRAIPEGAFSWEVHRSTLLDQDDRYPDFRIAERGEMAMKKYLSENGKWLRGEFYLADSKTINSAWKLGREAALNAQLSSKRA